MGKSETATSSIGIKIKFVELANLLNADNFESINSILNNAIIEDENEHYNDNYQDMISEMYVYEVDYKNNIITFDKYKQELMTYTKLFDYKLLIPVHEILSTTRWGYDRDGVNSSSMEIKDAMKIINKKLPNEYKFLSSYPIVFMLYQVSG
jgi:hypothetical protein